MKFKVGDLVKLKSGGPTMTVNSWKHYGRWECTWFSGKKHETGEFSPDALVLDDSKGTKDDDE